MNISPHWFLTLSLSSRAGKICPPKKASPNDWEPGKGHYKAKGEVISWWACLSHDSNLCTRFHWSLFSPLLPKDNAELQGRVVFLFSKDFLDFCFSEMMRFPKDRCSCSQDQSLLVAKTVCLGPGFVIPIHSPSGEPNAISKAHSGQPTIREPQKRTFPPFVSSQRGR